MKRVKGQTMRRIATVAVSMLAFGSLLSLAGCKPTDFFTEVVITPFSDVVDENNDDAQYVETPTAERESMDYPAVVVTDNAKRTEKVQNLIVYSSSPNTDLTTRHSVFDVNPRFYGIESSDAVRLVFNKESGFDFSSYSDDAEFMDALSKAAGNSDFIDEEVVPQSSNSADGNNAAGDATSTDTTEGSKTTQNSLLTDGDTGNNSSGGGSGTGSGTNTDNDNGDDDSGKSDSDNPGNEGQSAGGAGGQSLIYDPGNRLYEFNQVNSYVAMGQAAVMVQAICGAGGLSALDEYTYKGLNEDGEDASYAGTFESIFSGKTTALDGDTLKLAWSGNGESPSEVDIDTLIECAGENGIIMYDATLGSVTQSGDSYSSNLFSDAQLARIVASHIQMVPIDTTTVQGLSDCADVIARSLKSDSTKCDASVAAERGPAYTQFISDCVKAVSNTQRSNAGSVAQWSESQGKLYTYYNANPLTSYANSSTVAVFATEFEDGVQLQGLSGSPDTTGGVLYSQVGGYDASTRNAGTPLAYWAQVAGVLDRTTEDAHGSDDYDEYLVVWQLADSIGQAADAAARYSSLGASVIGSVPLKATRDREDTTYGECLGSASMPYLIVSSGDDVDVTEAYNATLSSMSKSSTLTTYSALNWFADTTQQALVSYPALVKDGTRYTGYIGSTRSVDRGSVFHGTDPVSMGDTIRWNPRGLLGDWTEGTMESVLESVWIATVYSEAPSGDSPYSPITDMGKFSMTLGGVPCTTLKQVTEWFYSYFYECDLSDADYKVVVPDESLKTRMS